MLVLENTDFGSDSDSGLVSELASVVADTVVASAASS